MENRPAKFSSYSQVNQTKIMKDHDGMIDWINELETKIADMEREVFCMRQTCESCPGQCEDCPAKEADSE